MVFSGWNLDESWNLRRNMKAWDVRMETQRHGKNWKETLI